MYDDERRPPEQAQRLLTAQVQRAPELTMERLQEQQSLIRSLRDTVRQLEVQIKAETVAKGKLGRQLREAQKQLADAVANSTDPGQAGSAPSGSTPEGGTSAGATEGVEPVAAQPTAPNEPTATVPPSELELPDLLANLEREQTSSWLAACLNRLWFRHGDIKTCLELLEANTELVASMTAGQRQLVEKIRGTVALEEGLARIVPGRALDPAYIAQAGRVMYCAYSTPVFHSNGYSIRTRGVVAGMKAAGSDVFVVGRTGYPWDMASASEKPARRRRHVAELDGVDYVHLPEGNLNVGRPDDYIQMAADTYVREARLRRPSMIHAASNYLNGLPALIAARRLGLPFVYEVRGLWEVTEASAKPGWDSSERYAWQARMEAFVADQADTVLAITHETREELIRRGVAAEKIELLPNGVDTRTFLPIPRDEAYAREHGISIKVPVIGFAGSMVEYEGLDVLLQAANILRGRKKNFQIVIAGSGGVYHELKHYKETRKLGWRVRFVGRRPADEIPRFLSCVDVVACPRKSLPVTEMISPLKPLEAFAASKPVVLSDVSPHQALVGEHQERGLLATAGNPKALADALQALIEDPELCTAKGRAGRLWAVDERQWTELGRRLTEDFHVRAVERHREAIIQGPEIRDLRIGLIADEFTTKTLQRAATIIPLDRSQFREQIVDGNLDLVLIESAWSGNGGQWHRGVGLYSDDEDADLRELLAVSRAQNVPTAFWNKEDPVHIERFLRTGSRVDHVFTTDADMIPRYLAEAHEATDGAAVTASSLPFYADPTVHNPLPGDRPYQHTIAYAGTFYGQRYAARSEQLTQLLRAAKDHGLAIYDRQLALPDSPYRFPPEFTDHVVGALPYDEVLDSYKAHVANLNVNSVADSPTMFSRRVVEIAASGGVLLSSWSRALTEVFGGQIPNTNNEMYWRAYLGGWVNDADEHLAEAWLQMRAVLRSHTVSSALVLMARTAGIPVRGIQLPTWGTELDAENAATVLSQSVRPSAVRVADPSSEVGQRAERLGIAVLDRQCPIPLEVTWWAQIPAEATRTWAEDMLAATRWGDWQALAMRYRATSPDSSDEEHHVIARPGPTAHDVRGGLVPVANLRANDDSGSNIHRGGSGTSGRGEVAVAEVLARCTEALNITMPMPQPAPIENSGVISASRTAKDSVSTRVGTDLDTGSVPTGAGTVLIAGHDLKFAQPWIEHLQAQGAEVLIDQWDNHAEHDAVDSEQLLARADTVFCEWGLGNAVWYSQRVRPAQRLIVRVHAQELRRPYLSQINHRAVAQYVFVGELMREAAVQSHGVPREKTVVIPNIVRTAELAQPKTEDAEFTIGLVGMVPQIKRLDRAVTVIEELAAQDDRWRLRIKGKRPEDYAWMLRREDEMSWYNACYDRIRDLNARVGRDVVVFDPHGNDMAEWFRGIGYGLSVSDLESFHLTLPDAAASGAVPVSLAWPGADRIYPRQWLVATLQQISDQIAGLRVDPHARRELLRAARDFVDSTMSEPTIFNQLDTALTGEARKDPA